MDSQLNINFLPKEMLVNIFTFLEKDRELALCCKVCRLWNDLINNSPQLQFLGNNFHQLCSSLFPHYLNLYRVTYTKDNEEKINTSSPISFRLNRLGQWEGTRIPYTISKKMLKRELSPKALAELPPSKYAFPTSAEALPFLYAYLYLIFTNDKKLELKHHSFRTEGGFVTQAQIWMATRLESAVNRALKKFNDQFPDTRQSILTLIVDSLELLHNEKNSSLLQAVKQELQYFKRKRIEEDEEPEPPLKKMKLAYLLNPP